MRTHRTGPTKYGASSRGGITLAAACVLLAVARAWSPLALRPSPALAAAGPRGGACGQQEQLRLTASAAAASSLADTSDLVSKPPPSAHSPVMLEDDPDAKLKSGIAGFYDGLSTLWEDVWGEHLHHGYYETDDTAAKKPLTLDEHRAAQVVMIDKVVDWAYTAVGAVKLPLSSSTTWDDDPRAILDVGCGIGGASRHLARRFQTSRVAGVTLSPVQAARAAALAKAEPNIADRCAFRVQDALALPETWRDAHDLVWSLECGEHVPNKPRFVDNLVATCAPGGLVALVTWCHRDLKPGETSLKWHERALLGVINRCYYLPRWCSVADYVDLFQQRGMQAIQRADWTPNIAPFWPAVIQTAVVPRNFLRLVKTGTDGVRSAIAMLLMVLGYRIGLIKFGLVACRKPQPAAA